MSGPQPLIPEIRACRPLSCWLFSLGFNTWPFVFFLFAPLQPRRRQPDLHKPMPPGTARRAGLRRTSARPLRHLCRRKGACDKSKGSQKEKSGLSGAGPTPAWGRRRLRGCPLGPPKTRPNALRPQPRPHSDLAWASCKPKTRTSDTKDEVQERSDCSRGASCHAWHLASASCRPGATRWKRLLKSFTRMACNGEEGKRPQTCLGAPPGASRS